MDNDFLYSVLIISSWVFLGGWVFLLLLASVAAFRGDLQ